MMSKKWIGRLCICVPGRGIIGTRSPRHENKQWKLPGGWKKPTKDETWRQTASRSTFMETGVLVPPGAITFIAKIFLGEFPTYIGFAVVADRKIQVRPRPGVEEESKIITPHDFLYMRNFLHPHRVIIQDFKLFTW